MFCNQRKFSILLQYKLLCIAHIWDIYNHDHICSSGIPGLPGLIGPPGPKGQYYIYAVVFIWVMTTNIYYFSVNLLTKYGLRLKSLCRWYVHI